MVEILAEVVKPDCPWGCSLVFSGSMESAAANPGSSFMLGPICLLNQAALPVRGVRGSQIR